LARAGECEIAYGRTATRLRVQRIFTYEPAEQQQGKDLFIHFRLLRTQLCQPLVDVRPEGQGRDRQRDIEPDRRFEHVAFHFQCHEEGQFLPELILLGHGKVFNDIRHQIDGRGHSGIGGGKVDGCLGRIARPGDDAARIDTELTFQYLKGNGIIPSIHLVRAREIHFAAFFHLEYQVAATADVERIPALRVDDDVEQGAGIRDQV